MTKRRILAISGSLRARSANLDIIEYIGRQFADQIELEIYRGLADLPHFNPDADVDPAPIEVADWRKQIRGADGILICTPEYVFSIPGTLKNALEWTVSTADFMHKPTALITASSLGEKGHESLLLILKTIEAKMGSGSALLISGARTKLSADGDVSDEITRKQIAQLVDSLLKAINE
jgi:chromate reductase